MKNVGPVVIRLHAAQRAEPAGGGGILPAIISLK
jgi:hypothetical protein